MNKIALSLTTALTLLACFTESEIKKDEEHYEAQGVRLVSEADESTLAEVVSNEFTASASDTITLSVGDTLNMEAKLLCGHDGQLEVCGAEDDHEGHNHKLVAEGDDHHGHEHEEEHEEGHDDHDEDALVLKVELGDESIAALTELDEEKYHIGVEGLKEGQTKLSLEFWHGDHVDISKKEFVLVVK